MSESQPSEATIGGELIPLGLIMNATLPPALRRAARDNMLDLMNEGVEAGEAAAAACAAVGIDDCQSPSGVLASPQWDNLCVARILPGDSGIQLMMLVDMLDEEPTEILARAVKELLERIDPNRDDKNASLN